MSSPAGARSDKGCCVCTWIVEAKLNTSKKWRANCFGVVELLHAPCSWREFALAFVAGFAFSILCMGPGVYSGQVQNADFFWWPVYGRRGSGCRLLDTGASLREQTRLTKKRKLTALATAGTHSNRTRVAVVVPYRNRKEQLVTFIPAIHQFLSQQNIEFEIFIVNQLGGSRFNRGALMNIGFLEASRGRNDSQRFHCVALHDIDLIPVDQRNSYDCRLHRDVMAWQISTAIDIHFWRLPSSMAAGGVNLLQTDVFQWANGFNNRFFGWGGEDNDFQQRLQELDIAMVQRSRAIGRYCAIRKAHHKSKLRADDRWDILRQSRDLQDEGVDTVRYQLLSRVDKGLYTMVNVDIWKHEDPDRVH